MLRRRYVESEWRRQSLTSRGIGRNSVLNEWRNSRLMAVALHPEVSTVSVGCKMKQLRPDDFGVYMRDLSPEVRTKPSGN
jgi:hypothetical protein